MKSKPGIGITRGWITLLGAEDIERYELFEETPAQRMERRRTTPRKSSAHDSPEPTQPQRSPSRVPGAPAR